MRSVQLSIVSLGLVAAAAAGCRGDGGVASSESDLTQSLTLRFERVEGQLSLRSSGKRLSCSERFDGLEGERVRCERSGEQVQIIAKDAGDAVVVVRDQGKERGYYQCTPSGDVEGLPALMKCKLTKLRARGSGGLSSPFDSRVSGVSVPNTHWVNAEETILRGMEPRTSAQFDELRAVGVSQVLIFKNETGAGDVEEERTSWAMPEEDVLHIPFQWKDLGDFQTPCEQTLEALRFVRAAEESGKKVFVHCTVGEDRTGYLAALYALLYEDAEAQEAFENDMCEHGYASGNPQKPSFVLGKLAADLTPLYRAMAFLVEEGALATDLDPNVCATPPEVPADFLAEELRCGVSTLLVP